MSRKLIIILIVAAISVLVFGLFSKIEKKESKIQEEREVNLAEKTIKVDIAKEAPDFQFTTLGGKEFSLSDFRGKPLMFWLVATWCSSCQVGAKVLSERISDIEKYDLKIVVLKIWNNLGYPGPSLEEFVKRALGENFNHQSGKVGL